MIKTEIAGGPLIKRVCFAIAVLLYGACGLRAAERVGPRPYELDWAGRTSDDHPPLVDFEDLSGWTVETRNAEARFERTREQQIWGRYVGKLTYRATGAAPSVRILPPGPIPITTAVDTVTCWIYGNNWAWAADRTTPQVDVRLLFRNAKGNEFAIPLGRVRWKEWFLLHRRYRPDQAAPPNEPLSFSGIEILGGRNRDDRVLYFDNIAVFCETLSPLTFRPRPARAVSMFPGQRSGTNTGPGKLPFPTRPETILPTGGKHCYYCGLTDGNYAQDQAYGISLNPWLVDFDLLKLHDLGCNFGMGNLGMFYGTKRDLGATRQEIDASVDRFLAATIAFGHPGFLVFEGGFQNAMRSYYMTQQLAARYTQVPVASIRYVDASGRQLDTSTAVANGVVARSQVVCRYDDGTVTIANGHASEHMRTRVQERDIDLPPAGYAGWTADGRVNVFSGLVNGRRCDYAETPEYTYLDGRGHEVRFPRAAGSDLAVCRVIDDGWELIPHEGADCGFAVDATRATALDVDGKEIGPAELRRSRGLVFVTPVNGAFSYRLERGDVPIDPALTCSRTSVVPGETVTVHGEQAHQVTVPADAVPGKRIWQKVEGAWIDFMTVPVADVTGTLRDNALHLDIRSNFMHPPWRGGCSGYTFVRFDPVALPTEPPLALRAVVGKLDGSDVGDGMVYHVCIVETNGAETVAAEQPVKEHQWVPIEADLSAWAGKSVRLKLVTDDGPAGNTSGDWGAWGDLRLQSKDRVLSRRLVEDVTPYLRKPGPAPIPDAAPDTLRQAKRAWLRYEGKGLGGTGPYATFALLNGVTLGTMAPAGGDEANGVFSQPVRVPLTAEAIRSLRQWNTFEIDNPNRDCFSVRRFWLELELADGRRCTSDVTTATFSQPGTWAHAEGIGVPHCKTLTVGIWFP